MNTPKFSSAFALAALTSSALLAAGAPCSVHAKKGAKKEKLAAMAKVNADDARKTALASLKDPAKATVKDSELEVERGCLIYSFDIAIAGRSGIQEIQVDAGNGAILSSGHESPKAEAAAKAKDKAKSPSQ